MIKKGIKTSFPSQAVSDLEKMTLEYGAKVAKAIESEWFDNSDNYNRHITFKDSFHSLRLYARGEQSIKKYKDEMSINGDLSYLNLDWKPVPIIPKFVDIVVNGMAKRNFVGINPNRANLLIAALDKLCYLKLSAHDIFLTVIGGFSITDPSADLAIAVALISSLKQQAVIDRVGICGEVGLTGEIRPVSHIDKRLIELKKCGFSGGIIPKKNALSPKKLDQFSYHQVSYIKDVLHYIFMKDYEKKHA